MFDNPIKFYNQMFEDFDITVMPKENNEVIVTFPEIWNSRYIYKLDDEGQIIERHKDYEY